MTTSEDFERRMYEYVILREDMYRLERAQKFGCKVSDFNVVVTGLGDDEAEKGKR